MYYSCDLLTIPWSTYMQSRHSLIGPPAVFKNSLRGGEALSKGSAAATAVVALCLHSIQEHKTHVANAEVSGFSYCFSVVILMNHISYTAPLPCYLRRKMHRPTVAAEWHWCKTAVQSPNLISLKTFIHNMKHELRQFDMYRETVCNPIQKRDLAVISIFYYYFFHN